eukprot:2317706-Rhodomonas_salina.1
MAGTTPAVAPCASSYCTTLALSTAAPCALDTPCPVLTPAARRGGYAICGTDVGGYVRLIRRVRGAYAMSGTEIGAGAPGSWACALETTTPKVR